jgi:hypothetical protein
MLALMDSPVEDGCWNLGRTPNVNVVYRTTHRAANGNGHSFVLCFLSFLRHLSFGIRRLDSTFESSWGKPENQMSKEIQKSK